MCRLYLTQLFSCIESPIVSALESKKKIFHLCINLRTPLSDGSYFIVIYSKKYPESNGKNICIQIVSTIGYCYFPEFLSVFAFFKQIKFSYHNKD